MTSSAASSAKWSASSNRPPSYDSSVAACGSGYAARGDRGKHRMARCILLGFAFISLSVITPASQQPDVLPPRVFVIEGARVIPEPGKVLEKATIVIRDGLIEAVDANVKPPADALVIKAKGLTVYAGFIDGL